MRTLLTSLQSEELAKDISKWIKDYANNNSIKSLVIGISGGIDSSLVSTLCAMTGLPTYVLTMPIRQKSDQHDLSLVHAEWLTKKFTNVEHQVISLDNVYDMFNKTMKDFDNEHAFANSKSRLRMVTLYQVAGATKGMVVGTGNKVEDFGVGFYTKYGDGGVDISPIADLLKSEVYALSWALGVDKRIIDAPPTDGLWEDGRTDADQMQGLSYAKLERAMELDDLDAIPMGDDEHLVSTYQQIRKPNVHKMEAIPVYKLDKTQEN
jgi:NAD+ synthase